MKCKATVALFAYEQRSTSTLNFIEAHNYQLNSREGNC